MSDIASRLTAALADRYRIERELGAGGMATVYLAEDLKHHRKVAIKVLKPDLAAVLGADRFVQEITTTAQLQHPNILPLHDSGEADGLLYYVMPYVEGESLRQKLDREKQLGIDEAVRLTTEVADALVYAHEHGVVHRDIKPENILLHAGRPVVADFGIALAVSAAAGGRMTETGLSLGTPHYMSPEQATAEKEITGRSDIYSLGAVLYEMLTGNPPHMGSSAQQIIMRIVSEAPVPVTSLRKSVPPNVAAALGKALEKLPADRFESAKAFAEALANPMFRHGADGAAGAGTDAVGSGSAELRRWKRLAISAMAGGVVMTAVAAVLVISPPRRVSAGGATSGEVSFTLTGDPAVAVYARNFTHPFAVSPDGRTIVFRASTDTTPPQLWVRRIGEPSARPIRGTERGHNPAISPDGAWVAFLGGGHAKTLRKVRIGGGEPTTVAKLDAFSAALSWASSDEILFEQWDPDLGIQRVDAAGGEPELAVPLDSAAGEIEQRRPLVLGGDRGVVVYASYVRGKAEPELALYRLSDGRRARLGIPGSYPLALIDGHLVYSRPDGSLMAVPLDVRGLRLRGRPVPLEPRVGSNPGIGTAVGLSAAGTLVYRVPGVTATSRFELVDTAGTARTVGSEFTIQGAPRFSPDGRDVVFPAGVGERQGWLFRNQTPADLWVMDLSTGSPTRLTSNDAAAATSWFPDGRHLLYSAFAHDRWELWSVPLDGSAPPSRVAALPADAYGSSVVPDGRSVVMVAGRSTGVGSADLVRVRLDGSGRVDTLVTTDSDGGFPVEPRVSPDGHWVAYLVQRGLATDAWVRSLDGSAALPVSVQGTDGEPLVWGPDSRRLYYEGTDGLVEIELRTSPALAVVGRHTIHTFPAGASLYDLSPDGKTFVVVRPVNSAADMLVVVNWVEQARRAWNAGGAR